MILDILSLVVILVFAIIGIKVGAAKVLVRIAFFIVAAILAVVVAHYLSELIYFVFVRDAIIDNISSVLADSAIATAAEKAAAILGSVPMILANTMVYFNLTHSDITGYISQYESGAEASVAASVEQIIKPSVVGLISTIAFVLLFILFSFIFRKLSKPVVKVFRLPLIRVVDSAGGFALGLVEGILVLYVLVLIIKLIIPATGGELAILNEEYIRESNIFSLLYFGGISGFVQHFIF